MATKVINVRYIHERRERFKDTIYGTSLEWKRGESHPLPEAIALKFLRHEDSFEDADNPGKRDRHGATAAERLAAEADAAEVTANAAIRTANEAIEVAKATRAKAIEAAANEAKAAERRAKELKQEQGKQPSKTEAEIAAEVEQAEKARQHEKAEQERQQREQQHHELLDQLDRCTTKQSLVDFAKQRFDVTLDGSKHTLPELRAEAKNLVDRFGLP